MSKNSPPAFGSAPSAEAVRATTARSTQHPMYAMAMCITLCTTRPEHRGNLGTSAQRQFVPTSAHDAHTFPSPRPQPGNRADLHRYCSVPRTHRPYYCY